MTKRALLAIIENSIMKKDVSLRSLYDKYMPLYYATLKDFADNVKITGLESLDVFEGRDIFNNFIRNNELKVVEKQFDKLLNDLRIWSIQNYAKSNPLKIPDGIEQKRMRNNVISCIDNYIALLTTEDIAGDYRGILEKLNEAQDMLRIIVFPRNDHRVVECYESIMSQLDVLLLDNNCLNINERVNIIISKIVEWQKCRR